jgi:hypothetical protein
MDIIAQTPCQTQKTMHNVFSLTIFLDVGAKKGNS